MIYAESVEIAGRELTIETGRLAWQAGGAVTLTYGETVVLATATASKEPRPGMDFFHSRWTTKKRCMPPERSRVGTSSEKVVPVPSRCWSPD
jgi:hypothetical protein